MTIHYFNKLIYDEDGLRTLVAVPRINDRVRLDWTTSLEHSQTMSSLMLLGILIDLPCQFGVLSVISRQVRMIFARLASITYILWGVLHIISANQVFALAQSLDPGIVQGRVYQDGWNLLLLAFFGITVAIKYNWRNSRFGYWLNLIVVSAGDIGFIITILLPGYVPLIPGGLGPLLWMIAAGLSTVAMINNGYGPTQENLS